MSQLIQNLVRNYDSVDLDVFKDQPMAAASVIYEGAALGLVGTTGVVRQLVAADVFAGFANRKADNSAGAAAARNISCKLKGQIQLNVVGVTGNLDVDSVVYASDSNTFTKTSTGNTAIGKIVRWISGTLCVVAFEADVLRSL